MRDLKYDAVKGLLMLGVLFGHYNYYLWSNAEVVRWAFIVNEMVYLVHMPLFFVVALMFCRPFSPQFVRRNVLKILVPFFLWIWGSNLIFAPADALLSLPGVFSKFLYGTHFMGVGIKWFLPQLFLFKLFQSVFLVCNQGLYSLSPRGQTRLFGIIDAKYGASIGFVCVMLLFHGIVSFYRDYLDQREVFGKTPWGITEVVFLWPVFLLVLAVVQRIDQWYVGWQEEKGGLIPVTIFLGLWIGTAIAMYKLVPGRGFHRVDLCQFNLPYSLWVLTPLAFLWIVSLSALLMLFNRPHVGTKILAEIGFFSLPIFLLHEQMVALWDRWVVVPIPESNYQMRLLGSLVSVVLTVYSIIFFSRVIMRISGNFSYFGFVTDRKG